MASAISLEYFNSKSNPVTVYRADLSTSGDTLDIPIGDITLQVYWYNATQVNYQLIPNPNFNTTIDVYKYSFWGTGSTQCNTWDSYVLSSNLILDDGSYSNSNEVWNCVIRQRTQSGLYSTYSIKGFVSGNGARATIEVTQIEVDVSYD